MPVIQGPAGDPTVIRAFTSHLLNAYDEFIDNFDGKADYVEGMMAAHNLHVFVIEHLVDETGDPIWRDVAKTTFAHRMENPGEQDTKRNE